MQMSNGKPGAEQLNSRAHARNGRRSSDNYLPLLLTTLMLCADAKPGGNFDDRGSAS